MSRRSRFIFILLTSFILLGQFGFSVRPAQAILGVGDVTFNTTVEDIPRKIAATITKVTDTLKGKLKTVTDITFKNSLQLFTSRLLREAATQIATAGPGQKPLFLTNPKTFFRNVANSAAGDYIDNFTRGITGQTAASVGSTRTRFLISRFLRSSLPNPLNSCQDDCRTNYSVRSDFSPGVSKRPSAENDHETKINDVLGVYQDINGSTVQLASTDPNQLMTCREVNTKVPFTGSVQPYIISPGYPGTQTIPQIQAQQCKNHQEEAINNEKSDAYAETLQCYKDCQNGLAGVATGAINAATATDVFTAVNNIEPSKVPGAIANALSNDKSDVGQLLGAFAGLTTAVQDRITGEQTNLQPNVLPRTSTVSEQVASPSTVTTATFYGLFQVSSNGQFVYTGSGLADILKGIASFINSPIGQLFTQSFRNKCGFNPDACRGPSNPQSAIGQLLFGTGLPSGIAGAQIQLSSLGQPQLISGNPGQNDIPVTDQLSTNGLIDSGFRQAIEEELTVQEALNKKLLDSQKVFGFDRNGVEPRDGYPYRALQYLRKFRVIPVGWELAAKYKQQFDNRNLTLGKLVKAFNICGQDQLLGTCTNDPTRTCVTNPDCTFTLPSGTQSTGQCTNIKFSGTHEVCTNNPEQACQLDADCGGGTCGASPYCGLVDPNWVLKAPQSFCRRQGAGEEILTKEFVCDENNVNGTTNASIPPGTIAQQAGDSGSPNCVFDGTNNQHPDIGHWVISRNTDTCADVQSCIAENDDGSCIAYGYCVQERQTFKFSGTQCDAQNVSCTAYTDSQGQPRSYLANTLDFRNCTADNAGCQWYCHKVCSDDPSRSCSVDVDCATGSGTNTATCTGGFDASTNSWLCADPTLANTPATNPTINFTNKVAKCDQTQAGCQQYLRTTNGTNLLPNSGFEVITNGVQVGSGADAIYADWQNSSGLHAVPVTPDDPLITANNSVAVNLSGSGVISQTIDTGAHIYEQTFTASVRAKAAAACTTRLIVSTNLGGSNVSSDQMSVTTDWQTFTTTLVLPTQLQAGTADDGKVGVAIQVGGCANLIIDNAQLEHDGPTTYKDYGAINATYLGAKRQQCTKEDVGCQLYTPTDGSPAVPGQILNSNRCDAQNVGCNLYHLEPITTVPKRSGGDVTVVATKGEQCSASDVGCEEYTNLDEVAKGGEGKAYFKSVKQCVKPNGDPVVAPQQTYYTWVGDPKAGFVLRAYDLLKSNLDGNPCTNLTVGTVGTTPACDDANRPDPQSTLCNASTFATNPDCGQYYDSSLNVYYRLRQATVSVTPDCHPFRNTIDQDDQNAKNNIYYLAPEENVSCSAAAAGCRGYTGNAAQTSRQIFRDDFETATTSNWVGGSISSASISLGGHSMHIPGNSAAYLTTAAVKGKLFKGKTYQVTLLAAAASSTAPQLGVWLGPVTNGKFDGITPFQRDANGNPLTVTPTYSSSITPPGPEWHTYSFGLLTLTRDPTSLTLGLTVDGGDAFVDNVTLTEINDSLYLVSSTVPACPASEVGCAAYTDRDGNTVNLKSFSRICSEQAVNCEALIDTHNSTSPDAETIKNISTPADNVVQVVNDPAVSCQAEAKGCQAVGLPTYNTDHLLTGYQTTYLKNNPDLYSTNLCTDGRNGTPNELFCSAYSTSSGTVAFFKDPTNQTCEFRTDNSTAGGQWYVTGTTTLCPTVTPPEVGRPVGASCTPTCDGGQRLGRACVSNADCPSAKCTGDAATTGRINDGSGKAIIGQCGSDSNCLGGNKCLYQVGTCPAEQNSCTEYRDPTDPKSCRSECPLVQQGGSAVFVDSTCTPTVCQGGDQAGKGCQTSTDCSGGGQCVGFGSTPALGAPGCRPYYYLSSSVEDTAKECNGQVNLATGCRPFNDTLNPVLNFRGQ